MAIMANGAFGEVPPGGWSLENMPPGWGDGISSDEETDGEKKEDQWNLFLLGLWRFQNMNQKDKLSYYQIAGMFNEPTSHLLITISFEYSLV